MSWQDCQKITTEAENIVYWNKHDGGSNLHWEDALTEALQTLTDDGYLEGNCTTTECDCAMNTD